MGSIKQVITFLLIILIIVFNLSCTGKGGIISSVDGEITFENDSTVTWAGRLYHKVKIGSQVWMKENLDVGRMITLNTDPADNGIIEKYYYKNDSLNYSKYGALYTWEEAMQYKQTEGDRGICPPGWHIPTVDDFRKLQAYVNFNSNALKALNVGYNDGKGTNTSGFSALLPGYCAPGYNYLYVDVLAYFWTSSIYSRYNVYTVTFQNQSSSFYVINTVIANNPSGNGTYGFSIRCIKDK